jgi:hypothetical protein
LIDHLINFKGWGHNRTKLYYTIKIDKNVIHEQCRDKFPDIYYLADVYCWTHYGHNVKVISYIYTELCLHTNIIVRAGNIVASYIPCYISRRKITYIYRFPFIRDIYFYFKWTTPIKYNRSECMCLFGGLVWDNNVLKRSRLYIIFLLKQHVLHFYLFW